MSGNFPLSDEGERGEALGDRCIDADGDCTSWLGKISLRSSKVDACTDLRLKINISMSIKLIEAVSHTYLYSGQNELRVSKKSLHKVWVAESTGEASVAT